MEGEAGGAAKERTERKEESTQVTVYMVLATQKCRSFSRGLYHGWTRISIAAMEHKELKFKTRKGYGWPLAPIQKAFYLGNGTALISTGASIPGRNTPAIFPFASTR